MIAQTIDFGACLRPDGETWGRVVMEIRENGDFAMSHMLTPDDGIIVATGSFHEYIKGLPDVCVCQMTVALGQHKKPAPELEPDVEYRCVKCKEPTNKDGGFWAHTGGSIACEGK